ncbi:hypothetical protein MASR1M66_12970 [Aminivibrio sp.]
MKPRAPSQAIMAVVHLVSHSDGNAGLVQIIFRAVQVGRHIGFEAVVILGMDHPGEERGKTSRPILVTTMFMGLIM